MMKKFLSLTLLLFSMLSFSQVGIGTNSPNMSAQLDVTSTTKGFLPPRMTYAEKIAIPEPAIGLMIWCTDCDNGEMQVFSGREWQKINLLPSGTARPSPPTVTSAVAGNGQAQISFTPPVSDGGSNIINYRVLSDPRTNDGSGEGSTSPITYTGLNNGTTYTFTVVAENVVGPSEPSEPTNSVTPNNVLPPTPNKLKAIAGDGQVTLSFVIPPSVDSIITGFKVYANDGTTEANIIVNDGAVRSIVYPGLTNGTAYTFYIKAFNTLGESFPSTVTVPVIPCGVPEAPTNLVVILENGSARIAFTPSANTDGCGNTVYSIISNPDSGTTSIAGETSPLVVSGLTPGTSYTFTVTAQNNSGTVFSAPSSTIVALPVRAICDGTSSTEIVKITSAHTNKIWMDRNLGAIRVATSSNDYFAYGCLFQWGRGNDGHASINWTSSTEGAPVNDTSLDASTGDSPGNARFIIGQPDWRSTENSTLWSTSNGTNNPCPSGFRVPTIAEFTNELDVTAYAISDATTAFESPFKFVTAGARKSNDGSLDNPNVAGLYWTQTNESSDASSVVIHSIRTVLNKSKSFGFSLRCIKN